MSTAEPALVRRVLERLRDDRSAVTGTAPTLVVLVVDGWEAVEDALDRATTGPGAESLLTLVRDGAPHGLRVIVTGGRAVGSGRVASLLDRRLVLHLPDPLDLTLVGVEPALARRSRPPGRAIDVADGSETQIATLDGGPVAADGATGVAATAVTAGCGRFGSADPDAGGGLPWRVVALPIEVGFDDVTPDPTAPTGLALGVGGDSAEWVSIALPDQPRRFLIVGPPRSGRSTTLELLARQLDAAGRTVVVITGRRATLRGGWSGQPALTATDVATFVALRRATPDLAVLVDDADALDGTELEQALVECARLADDSGGLVWASAETARATAAFRGLLPALARDGNGLVLSPTGPADGEVLRARPDPAARLVPGRGALVLQSRCTPLQVAHPAPGRAHV